MRAVAWLLVRLRWPIVLAWIAAAIAVVVYLPSLEEAGDETSLLGLVPEDAASLAAGLRSSELFDVPVITHTAVVQRDPDGLSRPGPGARGTAGEAGLERGRRRAAGDRGRAPIANARGLVPGSRESGTTAITYLFFDPAKTDLDDQDELARRYARRSVAEDAVVGATGAVPARMEEWREIAEGLPWVTAATIAAIALILGIHFRSPVAPLVTLVAAATAYLVSLRTVGAREGLDVTIPRDAEPILVVLLLGVVTDYAVFFLHGFRERLAAGEDRLRAAEGATAEYLPIVVTAGLIVAGGTLALVAGQLDFFRAFGPGMALTVAISLLVAITFVPAALAILGARVFWPWRAHEEEPPPEPGRPHRAVRDGAPRGARDRPRLGRPPRVAARSMLQTDLGISQIRGLPAGLRAEAGGGGGRARVRAGDPLADGAPARRGRPSARPPRARAAASGRWRRSKGVAAAVGPASPRRARDPGLVFGREESARYLLVLDEEPQGSSAIDIVTRLRERVPALLEEAGLPDAQVSVAGDTALAEETVETISQDLVRIGIAAFLVNFLLLVVFLRAVLAPLYLVLASTLALAASIGLTTLVFQGFLGHDDLTYHVPFAVAVLLLSLGSDYNVFVVGRIWREAERMPLPEAIAVAAPRASRAITVAGLALAASFAALALIDLRQFREFAFAMVVGILLDAFLVRSLLIPALISLFGERSWWPWRRRVDPALEAA